MLGYRSDNTSFDLLGAYVDQRATFSRSDYTDANDVIHPFGAAYNPDQNIRTYNASVDYALDQVLVSDGDFQLKLQSGGRYEDGRRTVLRNSLQQPTVPGFFGVSPTMTDAKVRNFSDRTNLYASFDTGPIKHQAVLLFDAAIERDLNELLIYSGGRVAFGQTPGLATRPTGMPYNTTYTNQYGAAFQDQMSWGGLNLTLGVRRTWYRQRSDTVEGAQVVVIGGVPFPLDATGTMIQTNTDWSPNIALLYEITKNISIYGSYNENFIPNSVLLTTENGIPLPPQIRKQQEIGVKAVFFSDRLSVNLSGLHYTTNNEAIFNEVTFFNEPGPGQKQYGAQISVSGSVTKTFKITGGYTHYAPTPAGGFVFPGIVHDAANIWMLKTVKLGGDSSLNLGLGGNYRGGTTGISFAEQQAGDLHAYRYFGRPMYELDAAIGYKIGKVSLNLTIDNFLDRKNYQPITTDTTLTYDKRRTIRLFANFQF